MKKAVLILPILTLLAGAAAYLAGEAHQSSPRLVGKCYRGEDGGGMEIKSVQTVTNSEGEEVQVYQAILSAGPIYFPRLLHVRKANAAIDKAQEDGLLEEVSCEDGEPLGDS